MGKVLRVFLVLALLASIGALAVELIMFRQRQELQLRARNLRESHVRISQKVAAPRDPFIEALGEPLTADNLRTVASMGAALETLKSNTAARCDQLYQTKDTLKLTRDELTATQQELARTRQELDAARQEIARLNEQLARKEAEIAQAKQKLNELASQIEELDRQIGDQKEQIAKLEKEKSELGEERQRLEDALAPFLPPPLPSRDMVKNLQGTVVIVDPEWNFVILDVGRLHGLQKNTTLLVHRGEQMIGRIRVSDVRDNLSVGDVEPEWMQAPAQPGDRVFIQ